MAKELIISIYDGGWGDFTAVVLNENKIEEISKDMESSLAKFGLYHRGDNVEVSITNEKVKQEYIEHQMETKEILRPEQCEHTTTIQAVIDLKLNDGSCWYDSYDYIGSVYDKTTLVWFTCSNKVTLPEKLGEFNLVDTMTKNNDVIYKYECKWNNYAPVKNGLGEIVKEAH